MIDCERKTWQAIWHAAEPLHAQHSVTQLLAEACGINAARLPRLIGLRALRGMPLAGLNATTSAVIGAIVGVSGAQGVIAWPIVRTTRGVIIPFGRTVGELRGGIVPLSTGGFQDSGPGLVLATEIKDALWLAAQRPIASVAFLPSFSCEIELPPALPRCLIVEPDDDGSFGIEALLAEAAEALRRRGRRVVVVKRSEAIG